MDYFDKKINEIYNQPLEDVPANLQWDQMEDGIYSKMEEEQPKRKAIWYWISGGMLLLIAVATIVIYNSVYDTKPSAIVADINTDSKTTSSQKLIGSKTENTISKNPSIQSTITTTKNELAKVEQESTSQRPNIDSNTQSKTNTVESNISKISIASNSVLKMNNSSINSSERGIQQKNYQIENIIDNDVKNTTSTLPKNSISVTAIKSLSSSSITIEKKVIPSNLEFVYTEIFEEYKSKTKSYNQYINLTGGTTFNTGYDVGENIYKNTLPGYNVRLGYAIENEKGWGLQLGLGHSLLVESFDLDLTDTISIQSTDAAIRTLTSTITGQTFIEYGDAALNSSRYRRELSYNTINLISLDAAISKRCNISSKWSLLPTIGLQYDRLISIEGKTLDAENEILAYDNATDGINKNLFSGGLGIQLQYNLNKRWSLSASANKTYSINSLYNNSGQLGITNISGGLQYRL